jgi:ElaB/YqjD/DUF883 family membrane-anchored ribosome-binding protein
LADHGKDKEMSKFVETTSKFSHGAVDTVKHNSVPAVLFGVGLGWLVVENLMTRSNEDIESQQMDEGLSQASVEELTTADAGEHHREYREGMSRAAQAAKQKAAAIEKRAEETAEQLKERAKHLRERAVHGVRSAESGFSRMAEERPLTLGLTGVAIGAVIGLVAAGAFRQEGSMGPARRERIRHRAGDLVHEAKERAGRAVQKVRHANKEAAEREDTSAH